MICRQQRFNNGWVTEADMTKTEISMVIISCLLSTEKMYRNAFRSPNPRHTRWQPLGWTFVTLNCTTQTVGFYWIYLLATGKMIQVDLLANGLTCIMNLCWRKYAAARYCQRENTDVTIRDATKRDGTRPHVPFIVARLINKPSVFFYLRFMA